MKEKLNAAFDMQVRQEPWQDSPCSTCFGSPCCSFLPLDELRLDERSDFVQLALLCCYDNLLAALKQKGIWGLYFKNSCRFLENDGKCAIHGRENQSLICKSYNAHRCWYKNSLSTTENDHLIQFDLERLFWLEDQMGLFKSGETHWSLEREQIIQLFKKMPLLKKERQKQIALETPSLFLDFAKAAQSDFLFLPPYLKPSRREHLALIRFRLGFSGVYLALSDQYWCFLIHAHLNPLLLERLSGQYFRSIKADVGNYHHSQLAKNRVPWSQIGKKWIVLDLSHLDRLFSLIKFNQEGQIISLPNTTELRRILISRRPDAAA